MVPVWWLKLSLAKSGLQTYKAKAGHAKVSRFGVKDPKRA
jgi:hypothetical protein